jgi:hypothetical protein
VDLPSGRSDEVNPYAAPRVGTAVPRDDREVEKREAGRLALDELYWPSLILMVLSALWGGNAIIGCFYVMLMAISRGSTELLESRELPFVVATCVASILIFYGAWCMRRGVRFRFALVTSFLACIPCLSPVMFLGIPFGFWALTVMTRSHVRAAFR